jgi:import inner membrane translocase subunit TIM44
LVLHKDSPRQEAWNKLKETNPILRTFVSLRQSYDESENPVVSSVRSVTESIGSWFDENETAQVTRMMKNMDPTFTREGFERELREYIIPEVVDAYLSADKEALKAWCGEAVSYCVRCYILPPHRFLDIQRTLGYHGTLPSSRFNQ